MYTVDATGRIQLVGTAGYADNPEVFPLQTLGRFELLPMHELALELRPFEHRYDRSSLVPMAENNFVELM